MRDKKTKLEQAEKMKKEMMVGQLNLFLFCSTCIVSRIKKMFLSTIFLCRLRCIAALRDHFVRHLSVRPSVCVYVRLSSSHTFFVVTHSYVLQETPAFLGMQFLPMV